jgi:autotransporter-associated beta strand protein
LRINGAFTVGRAISVGSVANTAAYNAIIGGSNTTGTSIFSGNITLNTTAANYTTTLQAATGGTVELATGTWNTNDKAIAIGSAGNTGTVRLSNTLATAGGISVNHGTLELGSSDRLGNTTPVNVNGGTLALATNTDTVGAVTLSSGSITGSGAGTLTGTGSAYDVRSGTVSAKLGGSVGLTKTTAGTVTLSGVNSYTGATAVNGGRLTIDTSGLINTSSGVTIAGGALRYNASTSLAPTVTFTSGSLEGTNWNGSLSGLTIGSGQTISPGNSPGTATTGSQTWAGLGSYLFEINNATGGAGADPGWDRLNGTGTLDITATSGSRFSILLTTLTLGNIAGDAANFSDATSYNWLFADFVNPITGYAADRFLVNTTAFDNVFTGTFGVALGNTIGGGDNTQLYLTYTAVPEPRAALLGGLGLLALLRRRR